MKTIRMEHGSGGVATGQLIEELFASAFSNEVLAQMEDAAVVAGDARIAITTDSFVVTPLEFPGGDIGRLAVCGTVNDLLMRGATPKYLTCGFILEEGLSFEVLGRVVRSMAKTAQEAGVCIVAGDTKVVEGNGGMYINTTGVGFVPQEIDVCAKRSMPGDAILLSGNLGDHHATILSRRMGITNSMESDNAPLTEMVFNLLSHNIPVHVMRDVTRGGLGTVLKELAQSSKLRFEIEERLLPVTDQVKDFAGLLGLDPLYMGNEGKCVILVPEENAEEALALIRASKYGENAVQIGGVKAPAEDAERGSLVLRTRIGGMRSVDVLQGEGLPRIC